MPERLPPQRYERIDRNEPIQFRFEGRRCLGWAGDTISSALWADGVRTLGRSFKYHRPRGIYSLANHDVNVLMEDGLRTHIRGDVTPISSGMELHAVNTIGGVKRDWLSVIGLFWRFMPVGFYYKAFHTPRKLAGFYERCIRHAAGLGRIDLTACAESTPKRYDFCDLLVVGSGPAGLSGAIAAAQHGLRVIVVDEQPQPGGTLTYQCGDDADAAEQLEQLLSTARSLDNLELRTSTEAAAYYADHWIALIDAQRMTKLRVRAMLVASGSLEQPAVFHNNDLPGVMLGSAAQRLMRHFAVKPCQRAVVLAANSAGYRLAMDLHSVGVDVAAVADLRPDGEPSDLTEQLEVADIAVYRGHTVYEATTHNPVAGIDAATLCRLDSTGRAEPERALRVRCDGLIVSVGWTPNAALLNHAGAKFAYDQATEQLTPRVLPEGIFAAGRVNGIFELPDQIADGKRAGLAAAQYLGCYDGPLSEPVVHRGPPPSHAYPVFEHPKGKNFVDFDEDLQLRDCPDAVQEGFDAVELFKRYSTMGMGPSQGKLSNMNAIRILARLTERSIDQTGATTTRPFYHPVAMRYLAGRRFHPHRHTPMHEWHARAGARFILAGPWHRPEYYVKAGRSHAEAILAEAETVRQRIGIIDVGTLGKMEVNGPDAVAFLERTFTGKFTRQKLMTLRYCLALDESGVVINDGVIGRLAEDRFYVTATTTGVAALYREMKRNALLWDMQVTLIDLTGHYAAMNIAGPLASTVLATLTDVDLSADAFGYLALRRGRVAGVDAMLLRVGFVGELGYEVHVPAAQGLHVWETLMEAGKLDGIAPFGVEAQRLLRLEKGHIIIGQDTDALTFPTEASLAWALGKNKSFFVGQRSLEVVAKQSATRKLVGFTLPKGYDGPLPRECHLIIDGNDMAGRVTSIAARSTLGMPLGLAYVRPDQAKPGTSIQIRVDQRQMIDATIVATPFYDPEQIRQKIGATNIESRPTTPSDGSRELGRSPVYHHLEHLKAQWNADSGAALATTIGSADDHKRFDESLFLCDVSLLPKLGLTGPGAEQWLIDHHIQPPQTMYATARLDDGGLIARFGTQEFFIEAAPASDSTRALQTLAGKLDQDVSGCYRIARQEATFLLAGPRVHEMLLQMCAVDLAAEAQDQVLFSSLAGVSTAILPQVLNAERCYRLWIDYTSADYLWETLTQIAGELGGGVVGAERFYPELAPPPG